MTHSGVVNYQTFLDAARLRLFYRRGVGEWWGGVFLPLATRHSELCRKEKPFSMMSERKQTPRSGE